MDEGIYIEQPDEDERDTGETPPLPWMDDAFWNNPFNYDPHLQPGFDPSNSGGSDQEPEESRS